MALFVSVRAGGTRSPVIRDVRVARDSLCGAIPEGFAAVGDGLGRRMLVREELKEFFAAQILSDPEHAGEASALSGRGEIRAIRLPDGRRGLIRSYRHGGLLGKATGRLFLSRPPRPFRELAITEEARRRGILTIVPCGACIAVAYVFFYRGWLVSEELDGAVDLWAATGGGRSDSIDRRELWKSVGSAIRTMHQRGVWHHDLNLKNVLVRSEAEQPAIYIIDFDRARLFDRAVPESAAKRNLARLYRSIRKLDPERKYISDDHWASLLAGYHGIAG